MVTRFASATLRQHWPPGRQLPNHPATTNNGSRRQRKAQRRHRPQRHPATSISRPRRQCRSRQPWANFTRQETPFTPLDPWNPVPPTPWVPLNTPGPIPTLRSPSLPLQTPGPQCFQPFGILSIPLGLFHPSGALHCPSRPPHPGTSNPSTSSPYPWMFPLHGCLTVRRLCPILDPSLDPTWNPTLDSSASTGLRGEHWTAGCSCFCAGAPSVSSPLPTPLSHPTNTHPRSPPRPRWPTGGPLAAEWCAV